MEFMVCYLTTSIHLHLHIHSEHQKRGWEPEALINWLALAGWGQAARSPSDSTPTPRSPESTAILTLPELIDQVRLEYPTLAPIE